MVDYDFEKILDFTREILGKIIVSMDFAEFDEAVEFYIYAAEHLKHLYNIGSLTYSQLDALMQILDNPYITGC